MANTLDTTKELGRLIGSINNEQQIVKENIAADEVVDQEQLRSAESIQIPGTLIAIKWTYGTTSFILNHPVYGELDSAVLQLDGGYDSTLGGFSFPGSFPLIFSEGSAASSLLYQTDF